MNRPYIMLTSSRAIAPKKAPRAVVASLFMSYEVSTSYGGGGDSFGGGKGFGGGGLGGAGGGAARYPHL